jgi:hypothetical protein
MTTTRSCFSEAMNFDATNFAGRLGVSGVTVRSVSLTSTRTTLAR